MEKVLFEKLKDDYDVTKEHPEKHIQTLALADSKNIEFLHTNGIKLKPNDWLVLAIEPEVLEKTVLRARDLGFIEAYIQNPSFLKQDIEAIVKRMGALENAGIPYKNEKGRYQSFLFSERGYNYIMQQGKAVNATPSIQNIELKDYADRIMETFALTSQRENVYKKLVEVEKEGLGIKESLMEIFKPYSDNVDYLSTSIDEILMQSEEYTKGRKVA